MKHVVFAEFPDRSAADAALRDLEQAGVPPDQVDVTVHSVQPELNNERPIAETNARTGIAFGLILGALVGGFMGFLVTAVLGLFPISTWSAIGIGAALGLAIGFVGGAISGVMNPDRQLDRMERGAQRRGGVVATVEVDGYEQEESIKHVFARHGAYQVDKRAL